MCSPSPPPPPDYGAAAREQGVANLDAARTQGRINNPNVYGPTGSQVITWDGDQPTIRQTLSPEQQALYEQQVRTQGRLGALGEQGANSLFGVVGKPLDFDGAPAAGGTYRPGGELQVNGAPSALDPNSLSAMPKPSEELRRSVIDAMMSRANESFGQQREQNNADLIARGLTPGSKGYEAEMDRLNRGMNDYRQQAEIGAGGEVERAFNMDMGTRQQGQSEQEQRFRQILSGDAQNFNQRGQARELGMHEQGQQNSQSNEARRAYIAELLAQRQTPLNEISALLSGSQVSNPFSLPGFNGNTQVAPAPIFGARTAEGQYGTDVYNAQTSSSNSRTSGIAGLAMAAAYAF